VPEHIAVTEGEGNYYLRCENGHVGSSMTVSRFMRGDEHVLAFLRGHAHGETVEHSPAPRTPRQWNAGDTMPEDRPDVVDERGVQWAWDCDEEAYVSYGRNEVRSWRLLIRLFGRVVEVLPETPEPAETPITTSVEDKIFAPWDDETVDALNDFQVRLVMHPFTCGAEHFTPGEQVLIATPGGWICPCSPACGYTQGWAHSFMADREAWPEQLSVRAWDRVAEGLPPAQSPQDVPIPLSESVEANGGEGDGRGDLRAQLIEALRLAAQTRPEDLGLSVHEQWYVDFNCVDCDADTLYAVLAHGLAAAGWRPPLPADEVVRTVCTMAGMFSATNRQDMAEWLVDTADAIRRGVPWPKLKRLPADEVEPDAMQWGYREHEGEIVDPVREEYARFRAADDHLTLVQREVRFGPWSVVERVEPKETNQ